MSSKRKLERASELARRLVKIEGVEPSDVWTAARIHDEARTVAYNARLLGFEVLFRRASAVLARVSQI